MKFRISRFGSLPAESADSQAPESQSAPDSRAGPDSRFRESVAVADPRQADAAAATRVTELRKQLLEVVLSRTIQHTGVPAPWISAELNRMVQPNGEEWVEIRLAVQVDEPRFFNLLGSFQAEFERRLAAADPAAREWVAGIAWKIAPDPLFEQRMPPAGYWELVKEDRLLTARQKGAAEWDPESLARHFSDTDAGQADFENTRPPERDVEDIGQPPQR